MHLWRIIEGARVVWISTQMKRNITAPEIILRKEKEENAACVATLDFRKDCSDATDATTDFSTCKTVTSSHVLQFFGHIKSYFISDM